MKYQNITYLFVRKFQFEINFLFVRKSYSPFVGKGWLWMIFRKAEWAKSSFSEELLSQHESDETMQRYAISFVWQVLKSYFKGRPRSLQ